MSIKHAFFQSLVSQIEEIYGRDEAEEIAYRLIDAYLGKTRLAFWDIAGSGFDLDTPEIKFVFAEAIKKLQNNEPVQYVVGHTYFFDHKLNVTPAVLIPRQETEELVSMIIKNEKGNNGLFILDIGTGSGCIPIALSKALDCQQVIGIDISQEALLVANENAQSNNAKVCFEQLDILTKDVPVQDLDIIVSNPPYVLESDKTQMAQNVLAFEPELALFVPDSHPLKFYEAIARKALKALKSGGRIYFEIHENFGEEVKQLLTRLGYQKVEIHQDLFLSKDRIVFGIKG